MFEITVKGADELIGKLTKLSQFNRVRSTISLQGVKLQREVRKYPGTKHGPNPAISGNDKVRRGFFYHLKHGNISVPYGRTRRLAGSWTVASSLAGWSVSVENNMWYAEMVQGYGKQTRGHAAQGWVTEKGTLDALSPMIIANITAALEKEVADVG